MATRSEHEKMKGRKFRVDLNEMVMGHLVEMCAKLASENKFVKVKPSTLADYIISKYWADSFGQNEGLIRAYFLDRKAYLIARIKKSSSLEEEREALESLFNPLGSIEERKTLIRKKRKSLGDKIEN